MDCRPARLGKVHGQSAVFRAAVADDAHEIERVGTEYGIQQGIGRERADLVQHRGDGLIAEAGIPRPEFLFPKLRRGCPSEAPCAVGAVRQECRDIQERRIVVEQQKDTVEQNPFEPLAPRV